MNSILVLDDPISSIYSTVPVLAVPGTCVLGEPVHLDGIIAPGLNENMLKQIIVSGKHYMTVECLQKQWRYKQVRVLRKIHLELRQHLGLHPKAQGIKASDGAYYNA